MPTLDASMLHYYAARASEYDLVYQKPERQADLAMLQAWLPTVFAGSRVLEVACGTGFWTQFIAPTASAIVALDAAPETLAIAQARVPAGKVSFIVGDAYALPLNLGSFNAAFAGFWFSHVPKHRQREFLQGLSAAVEPGATLVLLDNRYVLGSNHPVSEQDQDGNTFQTRQLQNGTVHRVLKNFPKEAELRMLTAGLGHRLEYRQFDYFWALVYFAGVR